MYSYPNLELADCSMSGLTIASWLAYWFPRWSGMPISWRAFQFVVIHKVKDFNVVNEAEVDVFLDLEV